MEKIMVETKGEYTNTFIPPRCRKPRTETVDFTMRTGIRKISREDAPVAFRYATYDFEREKVADPEFQYVEFRLYDGELYTRRDCYYGDRHPAGVTVGDTGWGWAGIDYLEWALKAWCKKSKRAAQDEIRRNARKFLLIGDELWARTGEPMYTIYTFGLGHNHAETAVLISTAYNHNIDAGRYFPASMREKAIESAINTALRRGDTNSVDDIRRTRKIEVLIPSAVKRNPAKEHHGEDPIKRLFGNFDETVSSANDAALTVTALALAYAG